MTESKKEALAINIIRRNTNYSAAYAEMLDNGLEDYEADAAWNANIAECGKAFYTEDEISEAKDIYEDFMNTNNVDAMNGNTIYVNRETDHDGNVISFYLGIEDGNGNAITGYDEVYEEK